MDDQWLRDKYRLRAVKIMREMLNVSVALGVIDAPIISAILAWASSGSLRLQDASVILHDFIAITRSIPNFPDWLLLCAAQWLVDVGKLTSMFGNTETLDDDDYTLIDEL